MFSIWDGSLATAKNAYLTTIHTVSFDWFLSVLEWILNLEFCLLKLLIFYQKLLWNIISRLKSSTFWVFRPVFRYVWSKLKLCAYKKNEDFNQTCLNIGSKTQNVEEVSLDLIFHNHFWWNIKSFSKQNSKLRIHSKPDRNQSKLTVCSGWSYNFYCGMWSLSCSSSIRTLAI